MYGFFLLNFPYINILFKGINSNFSKFNSYINKDLFLLKILLGILNLGFIIITDIYNYRKGNFMV